RRQPVGGPLCVDHRCLLPRIICVAWPHRSPTRVTAMKLSVIVPAHNEEAYLAHCLQSVFRELWASDDKGPFEVIVVDNASTDRTTDVAARFANVRVISEPRKGVTQARQRGLEEARGELLAYVDADTRMPPGWISKILDVFASSEAVVCVSGPYVYDDL